jgi:hypothetical protein
VTPSAGTGAQSPEFVRLQAEARYARERYQLYKARTRGPKPTTPGRLIELERICDRAESRLRRLSDPADS